MELDALLKALEYELQILKNEIQSRYLQHGNQQALQLASGAKTNRCHRGGGTCPVQCHQLDSLPAAQRVGA